MAEKPGGGLDFVCAECGETFPKAWTDEEAEQEALLRFGEIPPEERAVVCEDCYVAIMGHGR